MKNAPRFPVRSFGLLAANFRADKGRERKPMKPISIFLSPTRSRPMNIFLGVLLLMVSLLLLLSLATWHAADPSLNTASGETGPHAVGNWVGLFGAWVSDLLLQSIGLTAFFIPIWLGGLGWTWMHSRPSGSPWLRWAGTLLALLFMPAVFGLLPWHWRWLHLLPIEGVLGLPGWLHQCSGRLACCRNSCRHRTLLRLFHQLHGPQRNSWRPLDTRRRLA